MCPSPVDEMCACVCLCAQRKWDSHRVSQKKSRKERVAKSECERGEIRDASKTTREPSSLGSLSNPILWSFDALRLVSSPLCFSGRAILFRAQKPKGISWLDTHMDQTYIN